MSLIIHHLKYLHPDREVQFEEISLSVDKGVKAGLVGHNGVGKSTLLKLIAGQLDPAEGQIVLSEKPWYIPQHLGQYDELSIASVLQVDRGWRALRSILGGDTDPSHFTDLGDDWTLEERMQEAFMQWGIGDLSPDLPMARLSGGQKTKVFLAGIGIHQPGMILLDEPTNHLDAGSRERLYEFVSSSKAGMLVVSHDRVLLNLLPQTFELGAQGLERYGGNFDFYRAQKEGQALALQAQLDEQSKTLRQTQKKAREMTEQRQKRESKGRAVGQSHSLPRIIAGGLKSQSEQSTARLLDAHAGKIAGIHDQIQAITARIEEYQVLRIAIGASDLHRGKILVDAHELAYSYDGVSLWEAMNFQIRSGDRIHLQGDNGAGKTTLIRLITGELEPAAGRLSRAAFTYLYLDQDYSMIVPDRSLYEQVQAFNSRHLQEHELKSLLTHCQFSPSQFDKSCEGLSGGEKMKLSLCCMTVSNQAPDLLILDEPANNLDIQSLAVLTAAVREFKGTLLLVSHDALFADEIGISHSIFVQRKN